MSEQIASASSNAEESVKDKLSRFTKYFGTSAGDLAKKYNQGLFGLVVGITTLVIELLTDEEVFKCPESGYRMYGIAYFVVPTVLLLFLNLLTVPASGNVHIWTLCESCCVKAYRRYGDVISGCFSATIVGFVAPFVWMFVALLNGRHLVCWELGYQLGDNVTSDYLKQRGFGNIEISQYEAKVNHAKAKSQIFGVVMIGAAVVGITVFIIARRSCIKPYDASDRLPGLWEFEKKEALAASSQLRSLLDDGPDDDVFAGMVSLLKNLFVAQRVKSLEDEMEALKEKEDEKKKNEKVHEIKMEIEEFENLKSVIKAWSEHNNLVLMKEHGASSTAIEEDIDEAKSTYDLESKLLLDKRERRIDAATSILKTYDEESNCHRKVDLDEILYQSWLVNRLTEQNRYFHVDKLMANLKFSKTELKDLRCHLLAYVEEGFADKPDVRGKIVASYIMQLYRRQNPFCRTAEQVVEKFQCIYPRAASSNPTDRYVNVNDYMYRHILDPEMPDDGMGSGPRRAVQLSHSFVKEWTEVEEKEWRKSKGKKW